MRALFSTVLVLSSLAAHAKPAIDVQAMREAMASSPEGEHLSSASSYAHFLRARLFHLKGDYRAAVSELRLALATDEQNPYLMTMVGEEYARLSELARAERELKKVIERHPSYAPAHLLLGRLLLDQQKYTRARLHLVRAVKLAPKVPEGYLGLSQLWLELGKTDESVAAIEAMGMALPHDATGFRRLGFALAERGDTSRAERMLKRAVDIDPGDLEAWLSLATSYESAERFADAEAAFSKALQREPDNQDVLFSLGRLALRQAAVERARGYFESLLARSSDPDLAMKVAFAYLAESELSSAADVLEKAAGRGGVVEPRLLLYGGLLAERLGRHARAAAAFAKVPKAAGQLYQEARLRRGVCLSLMGQHQRSLELLKAGIQEEPDSMPLRSEYAKALRRAGRARDAEGFLLSTLKKRPEPELFEALVSLYERQGRLAEAVTLMSRALEERPTDEALLFTLASTYHRQGEVRRSVEKMRAVLELNPNHALALNFIGYALAEQGVDLIEAERLVSRALELKPDTGSFVDSLGWVYYRRGEYERAVRTLEKAARLSPGEATIHEHLGDAYGRVARHLQAIDAYRRALESLDGSADETQDRGQRAAIERKLRLLRSERARR